MDHPELHESDLDSATLALLLADIEAHTQVLSVLARENGRQRPVALDEVISALGDRRVQGVQIRYRHDRVEWWDVLMVREHGVRLVRMRQ